MSDLIQKLKATISYTTDYIVMFLIDFVLTVERLASLTIFIYAIHALYIVTLGNFFDMDSIGQKDYIFLGCIIAAVHLVFTTISHILVNYYIEDTDYEDEEDDSYTG